MGICTICLLTLALTFLTTCTQAQVTSNEGLPVIKTHPHEYYYIVKRRPVRVTCEAYDAMRITFNCSGLDVEAADNFQTFDPASGRVVTKSSITVTQEDVRRLRGREYWCECLAWAASDDDSFRQTDRFSRSRRGVVSVAYLKRKFHEEPTSQTTEVGSKVMMKCSPPQANPDPEIIWRKDKKRLSPETDNNIVINDDGSLVIHVVKMSDAGEYNCIVRNQAGRRESKSATLTVTEKSRENLEASDSPAASSGGFMEEPNAMSYVTAAKPVTIKCKVQGAEILELRCNGERIPDGNIEKHKDRSAGIISVRYDITASSVEQHKAASRRDFSCECHSWFFTDAGWSSTKSVTGVVKLASIGNRFVQEPSDKIVKPGSTVKFTCKPPKGEPKPEITWMRNGARVSERQHQNIRVRDGVLTVSRVTRRDMADFSCMATNIAGSRTSGKARLTVSDRAMDFTTHAPAVTQTSLETRPPPGRPSFQKDLDEFYYITRQNYVTLTCKVYGSDLLSMRCNGKRLDREEAKVRQEVDRRTNKRIIEASTNVTRYQVESFQGDTEFTCQCFAWYKVTGSQKWQIHKSSKGKVVTAHLGLRFQKEPRDQIVKRGETATFECSAPEGNPKPKLYWSKDGARIDAHSDRRIRVLLDGGQLVIRNVKFSDAGSYKCEAENPAGMKMSQPALLTLEGEDVDKSESSTTEEPSPTPTSEPEPETTAEPTSTTPEETTVPVLTPGVPIFTKLPEPVYYIIKDKPVTITCRTLGAEHLTFACNKVTVPEAFNDTYTAFDPETNLKILERSISVKRQNVENYDHYECECTALYALPEAQDWIRMSKKTRVEIAYIKKRFMQEPVSQSVEMKVTTEIPCRPPKANPEPTIYWLKDNHKINEADDPNFSVSSTGSLVIREMREQDAGIYVCVAENPAGKRMSPRIEITVYKAGEKLPEPTPEGKEEEEVKTVQPVITEATEGPPIFVDGPSPMNYIIKGKPVVLSCRAEKTGKITFYCNEAHVDPAKVTLSEHYDKETKKMSLMASYSVTREDVASTGGDSEYSCQCFAWYRMSGDNTEQFVSSRAAVTKIAFIKGESVKKTRVETGNAGQLVSLNCPNVMGVPYPVVSWEKDGHKLEVMKDANLQIPGDGSLVIIKARLEDSGIYSCTWENLAGRKESARVDLRIKGIHVSEPEPTSEVQPETTPEMRTKTTTQAEMATPNVNQCVKIFSECTAIINKHSDEISKDPMEMCKLRMNYTVCTDRYLDLCRDHMEKEHMQTVTSVREGFDKHCKTTTPKPQDVEKEMRTIFPGCPNLHECYTESFGDVMDTSVFHLCPNLQSFFHCVNDALMICNMEVKTAETGTTLSDIENWFSEYCTRIAKDERLGTCEKPDVCYIPVDSEEKKLIEVDFLCPYLHSTLSCTQNILSDCGLEHTDTVESDVHYLNTQAQKLCPTVVEEGSVVGKTIDDSDGNAAARSTISIFAATLLQILATLLIAYR